MRLGAARWLSNPERRSKFGILGLSELDTQFARFASRSFRCDERLLEHRKDPLMYYGSNTKMRVRASTTTDLLSWIQLLNQKFIQKQWKRLHLVERF